MNNIIEQLQPLAVDVRSVKLSKSNPKIKHGLEQIAASLKKYGQRKPIVVNETNTEIEAGNGTYQAATQILGWTEIAAVFVKDDEKAEAGYRIADNRVAEYGEWDLDILQQDLELLEGEDDILFEGIAEEIKEELFQVIDIDKLTPGQATHAMSPNEFNRLKNSIKSLGILDALLVREDEGDNYVILDGRQRWKAAKELGFTKLACRILNPETSDAAISLGANYIKGKPVSDLIVKASEKMTEEEMINVGMNKERVKGYRYTANYETVEGEDGVVERSLRELQPNPLGEGTSLFIAFSEEGLELFLKAIDKTGLSQEDAMVEICEAYLKGE